MMAVGARNESAIRSGNALEEIRFLRAMVTRRHVRAIIWRMARQGMNTLVRNERPSGGHGLHIHRLCQWGFTWCAPAVEIWSLTNLPSIRTRAWSTWTRCWCAAGRKIAGGDEPAGGATLPA